MTPDQARQISDELVRTYAGAEIKVAGDRMEIVAELQPRRAIAVIECSQPHFHSKMVETYRVLRGTLYVACAGRGHVLQPGDALAISPGQVHHARGAGGVAWIEVFSDPPWTADDHFVL